MVHSENEFHSKENKVILQNDLDDAVPVVENATEETIVASFNRGTARKQEIQNRFKAD